METDLTQELQMTCVNIYICTIRPNNKVDFHSSRSKWALDVRGEQRCCVTR